MALGNSTITVDGVERTYTRVGSGESNKLLVALHGRFGNGLQYQSAIDLDNLLTPHGWTIVYPDALDAHWADGRDDLPQDDEKFLATLVRAMEQAGHAAVDRASLIGHSNGAAMALRLLNRKPVPFRCGTGHAMALPSMYALDPVPGSTPLYITSGFSDVICPFSGDADQMSGYHTSLHMAQSFPPYDTILYWRVSRYVWGRSLTWRRGGRLIPVTAHVLFSEAHPWPTGWSQYYVDFLNQHG